MQSASFIARGTYAVFFLSGFSSLCYEMVYAKELGYVFGTTAHAVSTVLAAFMTGLALGSFLGGRWSVRMARPVLAYGVLELGVGIYSLATPALFRGLTWAYSHLGSHLPHDSSAGIALVTLVRFLLAGLIILPPTFLMGATFPMLTRGISRDPALGRRIGQLYTANTLGAAFGTLIATYVLLGALGISGTIAVAAALNTVIFVWSLVNGRAPQTESDQAPGACRAIRSRRASGGIGHPLCRSGLRIYWILRRPRFARLAQWRSESLGPELPDRLLEAEAPRSPTSPPSPTPLYVVAALSGFLTLSFEVAWSHVLALLVGTSTYAFGIVLFTFLVALGAGGAISARLFASADRESARRRVAWLLVGVSLATAVTLGWWDRVPLVFALLGLWEPPFWVVELVRAQVAFALTCIPTVVMGTVFPSTLVLLKDAGAEVGRRVGVAYACNTAGTILGSTVTGFALIALLGSEWTLRVLGVLPLMAAAVLVRGARRRMQLGVATAVVFCTALLLGSSGWDVAAMSDGSNIYLAPSFDVERHDIRFLHEDVHGGFSMVIDDGHTRTLMTNGKFEGSNGAEKLDQAMFAFIPSLYVSNRDRALNIGVGTGQTVAVIEAAGYRDIDAIDMSPGVVAAARQHFADINAGVLDKPHVHVRRQDGRNHLLLNRVPYDLISIEITSVWFANAANLYSRDFYALCARHMTESGVLQQWVQLHHITLDDIATVIRTARAVFPHVELWVSGHQGILLASLRPLVLDSKTFETLSRHPRVLPLLERAGVATLSALSTHRLIAADQMDATLAKLSGSASPVSDDDNLLLEYSTPRGNVLRNAYAGNLAALRAATTP